MERDYKLSTRAIKDVAAILSQLHTDVSPSRADAVELLLFQAFADLRDVKGLGHARPDLTKKKLLFYAAKPYVIVLRQSRNRAFIARVLHGARDLSKLF